ncbi:MAG: sialate O-acetylesterase [Planctomycetota bacterium]
MSLFRAAAIALLASVSAVPLHAQRGMPRADVIRVPAVGEGLCVDNLFQSNMVLQRDRPIRIWGKAAPGERVVVSFGGKTQEATARADRSWSVSFAARAASAKPAAMTIKGEREELDLENILIGDVWVCGGQSNMEFPIESAEDGWLEIVSARFDDIRILTIPARAGPKPLESFPRLYEWSDWSGRHFRKGVWDVCGPETTREFSAIGYVFARRLRMAAGIPIGVIDVSRGGTTIETWTPEAVLRGLGAPEVKAMLADWDERIASWDAAEDLARRRREFEARARQRRERGEQIPANWKEPDDLRPGPALDPNRPGNCYNGMIAPIAGLAVKGAIFHQGYNNALGGGSAGAAMYYRILGPMIRAWREAFGDPEMPFGIISLCTDGPRQTKDDYVERMLDDGVYIREAQYRTFLDLRSAGDRRIGFASSYDQRRSWYHPQLKIPVGERISRWALATLYGFEERIRWLPPACTRVEAAGGALILRFDGPVAAADRNAPIEGFSIAGEDRRFQPASAEWPVTGRDPRNRPRRDTSALVLKSPLVPAPIHFRYAWARNPMGNLRSAEQGIPFATQRSDDWRMEDVPLGVLGGEQVSNGRPTRAQRAKIREALRKEDLRRRLAEARSLLDAQGKPAGR